jgi:alanyl-tRNA synthetase
MLTQDIRTSFLNYFKKHQHTIVPSDGLIPSHDPTLLFTNAGMVPFKGMFTGEEKPIAPTAASVQKCLRAGGKHNDLDNVGYTSRHHTFFEMMGNFSFGDYFKEQAITLAWTYLTKELGINPNKLYITYYASDLETRDLWQKLTGFGSDRLLPIATADNFWSMGATGPCGPCTEIFYDHGDQVKGGLPGTPEEDGDRYVEIWNLVFMQFDQLTKEKRVALPNPCIDTGMGLERIAAVLQGTYDNFQTNIFKTLIETSAALTQTAPDGPHRLAHQVIADHIRASCFLISEGILPSNEGRGYVLRRIMRRALRYVHTTGYKGMLLPQLAPTLINLMGDAYPELNRAQSLIESTLQAEEEKFSTTLSRGLSLLEDEIQSLSKGQALSGSVAFKLYDTYGFPLDMTQDALKSQGLSVNTNEFDTAMAAQKQQARQNWQGSGDQKQKPILQKLATELGETTFIGYQTLEAEANIRAIIAQDQTVDTLATGQQGYLVVDQTPFYAESGGQVGDTGTGLASNQTAITILDTQKTKEGLYFHHIEVTEGTLTIGQTISLAVNNTHRQAVAANHSATHLLHAALRLRFGDHVTQKGSLVTADKLRFDFTHTQALSVDDITALEHLINTLIRQNAQTQAQVMPYQEALQTGALALFGEKYANDVRVITLAGGDQSEHTSTELCGGTHVKATGEIGLFKIISQSSVAAGVRRIEAITGQGTERYLQDLDQTLNQLAQKLQTSPQNLVARLDQLLADKKKLEKQPARSNATTPIDQTNITINDIALISETYQDLSPKDLLNRMDNLKKQNPSKAVFLLFNSVGTDKVSAVVGVSTDLTKTVPAPDLIKEIAPTIEGKGGGGRPDLAQCGGKNSKKIPETIKKVEKLLNNK